jgi:orotidine-5'-phosphate decarboxylase
MIPPHERLIVALDVSSSKEAWKIVSSLGESVQIYKVGMQLYTAEGPQIVRDLVASGRKIFLDLKYHDIPNTVVAAVREAAQLGVSMLTVHASGGTKMLHAAVEAACAHVGADALVRQPRTRASGATQTSTLQVLAVTVLTSMNDQDLNETGVQRPVVDQVVSLAYLALEAGCAGVVSSAREVKTLRAKLGSDFLVVTPGVRPAGSAHGDQARVATPAEAIAAGATHVVVGRPITAAANPAAEAAKILQQLGTQRSELETQNV